jgi:hypothetical protein
MIDRYSIGTGSGGVLLEDHGRKSYWGLSEGGENLF